MLDVRKLDRLVAAFEKHGIAVSDNLRPGASDDELDKLAEQLGVRIPDDVRALFKWRNGHHDPEAEHVLRFRDNTFLSLDQVPFIYNDMIEFYGDLSDEVDLSKSIPIAEFMGSTYAVAAGGQALTRSRYPVVGVFQGVGPYYLSVESMIDTCIAWVEQPNYSKSGPTPNEMEIWKRHNPGIFGL